MLKKRTVVNTLGKFGVCTDGVVDGSYFVGSVVINDHFMVIFSKRITFNFRSSCMCKNVFVFQCTTLEHIVSNQLIISQKFDDVIVFKLLNVFYHKNKNGF